MTIFKNCVVIVISVAIALNTVPTSFAQTAKSPSRIIIRVAPLAQSAPVEISTATSTAMGWFAFMRTPASLSSVGMNLSLEQTAKAIETGDRRVFRTGAVDELVRILANAGLPVWDRASLAAFIRSDKVRVVDCTSDLVSSVYTGRINTGGKADMNWRRGVCYKGEKFLEWHDTSAGTTGVWRPFLSLGCGNPLKEVLSRLPEVMVASLPESVAPIKPVPECVPLPEGDWNIAFPYVDDIEAWRACNPDARCSYPCEQWILGNNSGNDFKDLRYARTVRGITGQSRGNVLALQGATMRPNDHVLTGTTVLCQQGTHNYWRLGEDGAINKGLD